LIFDLGGSGLASARGETLMVVDSWAWETRSGGFTPGKRLFMWDHDIPTIVENKCEVGNQIGITDYNGIVISVYLYIIIYMCVNIIHTKQLDLFSSHSAGIRTRPLWPKA